MRTQQISRKRPAGGEINKRPLKKKAHFTTVPRTRGYYGQPGEMKYFDCSRAVVTIPTSATWVGTVLDPNVFPVANTNCLFCPTQGVNVSQRIGKQCKLFKIRVRGTIVVPPQQNVGAAFAGAVARIVLVQDKQTNATQMTGTQLFAGSTIDAPIGVHSFQNIDNFGRFRILKDKTYSLQVKASDYDGTANQHDIWGQMINFKMSAKFRNGIDVHFNNTNGGTIADIVDNSFHIVAMQSFTDMAATITYNCRCSFKE